MHSSSAGENAKMNVYSAASANDWIKPTSTTSSLVAMMVSAPRNVPPSTSATFSSAVSLEVVAAAAAAAAAAVASVSAFSLADAAFSFGALSFQSSKHKAAPVSSAAPASLKT